jgi:hypothetical protein
MKRDDSLHSRAGQLCIPRRPQPSLTLCYASPFRHTAQIRCARLSESGGIRGEARGG